MGIAQGLAGPAQLGDEQGGEAGGVIHRFPLGQVDQDIGDHRVLVGEIDAGDDVGLVFLRRQFRRFLVRSHLGQGVDRGSAHLAVLQRVGVKRDKQIGRGRTGLFDTAAKAQEYVAFPGQHDVVASLRLEARLDRARHRQGDVFFAGAAMTRGAGIDAAMARIDDDDPFAGAPFLGPRALGHPHRQGGDVPRPIHHLDLFHVGLSAHLREIEDDAIAMTVGRIQHEGSLDPDRRPHIEHDARLSRREEAETETFYQAAAGAARPRQQPPRHLGEVDDHPVRRGKGEDPEFEFFVGLDHETGHSAVIADADAGDHGLGTKGRPWRHEGGHEGKNQCENAEVPAHIAVTSHYTATYIVNARPASIKNPLDPGLTGQRPRCHPGRNLSGPARHRFGLSNPSTDIMLNNRSTSGQPFPHVGERRRSV